MANYYGTTVSEGGKIKDADKVREIVSKWRLANENDGMTVEVQGDQLHVYGYEDFYIYDHEQEDEYDDMTEHYLKELCPYIVEPLIIKSVGNEKCRYVGAGAWIVTDTEVMYASLDEAIGYKLNGVKA